MAAKVGSGQVEMLGAAGDGVSFQPRKEKPSRGQSWALLRFGKSPEGLGWKANLPESCCHALTWELPRALRPLRGGFLVFNS